MFYWDGKHNTMFLNQSKEEIETYIKKAGDKTCFLEFVPDDNIEYLKHEADGLKEVL